MPACGSIWNKAGWDMTKGQGQGRGEGQGRLALLESLIREEPGLRLVDIGSDHASLPIRLMKEGLYDRVLVTDIRPGPLKVALKRAKAAGLDAGFESLLTDGLTGIELSADDLLLISGLGGETLAAILEAEPDQARRPVRLILQPQSREEILRQSLFDLGLPISAEYCVQDEGQVYLILVSDPRAQVSQEMTALELFFGPRILEACQTSLDQALKAYLAKRIRRLKKQAPYDPSAAGLLAGFSALMAPCHDFDI